MKRFHTVLVMLVGASCGCSALSGGGSEPGEGLTPEQKTIYSIGWNFGRQLHDYHLTPEETDLVARGLEDAIAGRPPMVRPGYFEPHALRLEAQRMAAAAAEERRASDDFVAAEAKRLGLEPSPSGLVFERIDAGTGASPSRGGTATVAYEIRRRDGAIVESSGERARTFLLASPGTLPCLREALLRMRVGGKSRLVCPPRLAYGDRSHGSLIPPGSALVIDAELVSVDQPVPTAGH